MKTENLAILDRIWTDKKWSFPTPEASQQSFDKLCEIVGKLNDDEQSLFIQLTRFYSLYSFTDYQNLVIKSLNSIQPNKWVGIEKIILLPLVSPEDWEENKAKSGHNLIYTFKNLAPYSNVPKNIKIISRPNPIINQKDVADSKILVVMVDDFIGSGKSSEKAVLPVKDMLSNNIEIIVISLVAMQAGISHLQSLGIEVFYADLAPQGIKDNPHIDDKDAAYSLIDQIWEKYLLIDNNYRRGYANSEGLVTLLRTPNNTFPMYWIKKARDGSDWPAPFLR